MLVVYIIMFTIVQCHIQPYPFISPFHDTIGPPILPFSRTFTWHSNEPTHLPGKQYKPLEWKSSPSTGAIAASAAAAAVSPTIVAQDIEDETDYQVGENEDDHHQHHHQHSHRHQNPFSHHHHYSVEHKWPLRPMAMSYRSPRIHNTPTTTTGCQQQLQQQYQRADQFDSQSHEIDYRSIPIIGQMKDYRSTQNGPNGWWTSQRKTDPLLPPPYESSGRTNGKTLKTTTPLQVKLPVQRQYWLMRDRNSANFPLFNEMYDVGLQLNKANGYVLAGNNNSQGQQIVVSDSKASPVNQPDNELMKTTGNGEDGQLNNNNNNNNMVGLGSNSSIQSQQQS